ncbi:MAG: hypothetical protein ACI81P_002012, partial [Neolewinella sp.]
MDDLRKKKVSELKSIVENIGKFSPALHPLPRKKK